MLFFYEWTASFSFCLFLPAPLGQGAWLRVVGGCGGALCRGTNCFLPEAIVSWRDWLLFNWTGTVWHLGLEAASQTDEMTSWLTNWMCFITCCGKRMWEHFALTSNIELDVFACFTVFLQRRKMPVLLSLMLLKFLIKISKPKETKSS